MTGLLQLDNWSGNEADLSKKIAQVGKTDSPLFSAIPKGVPVKSADRFAGHSWKYETMPTGDGSLDGFEGGSAPEATKYYDYDTSMNHYQIFKDTYGIEGSMEDAQNIAGKQELARQKAMAYMNHRMTIEKALFKTGQAPVKENKGTTTPAQFGSLDHWCTVDNTHPMGGAITEAGLREFMKIGGMNGVPYLCK
jgi:hypothetical protein